MLFTGLLEQPSINRFYLKCSPNTVRFRFALLTQFIVYPPDGNTCVRFCELVLPLRSTALFIQTKKVNIRIQEKNKVAKII